MPRLAVPVDAVKWAKMAFWRPEEAACITVGFEPDSVMNLTLEDNPANAEAVAKTDLRLDYLNREIEMGNLKPKLVPKSVFEWLDAIDEPYPDELLRLTAKIKPYGPVIDADPSVGKEVERSVTSADVILPPNQSAMTRKIATLRKIFLALVRDAYGYDRDARRSTIVKDIRNALELAGLSLDDDTIRKHLKQATDDYWID